MYEQVFIAVGKTHVGDGEYETTYVYPFLDPDAAMDFVGLAKQYDDDGVDHWEILTEVNRTALAAFAAHRAWVEE